MRVILVAIVAVLLGIQIVPAAAAPRSGLSASSAAVQPREPEAEPEPTAVPQMPVLDQWTHGATDTSGVIAGAGGTEVTNASAGGGGSGSGAPKRPFDCLVIELDPTTEGVGSVTPGLRGYDLEQPGELTEGHRYYQECWWLDTGDIYYANVWDQGPPGSPGLNARVLAQSALSRVPFTVPVPYTAPTADGEQITGLPTWLWLDPATWLPVEAHAESAGVSVTVTATPVRVEWDMGDGTVVECDGPGLVWNPDGDNAQSSDCEHVFQYTSANEPTGRYEGSVSIVWSIAWRAEPTGETGVLPDGRSSSPLSLLVNEMQAVVTYDQ